jgi:inorganic pyrophosphatase
MEDNAGQDEKIIAVPSSRVSRRYETIHEYSDLPEITRMLVEHFFEHYKDLEPGKWVKLGDWHGAADARRMIIEAIERAKSG